jgi:hypothetical protein
MVVTSTSKDNTLKVGRVCSIKAPYTFGSTVFVHKHTCELKKDNKVVVLPHPSYRNRRPITCGKVYVFVLPVEPLESEANAPAGEYLLIPRDRVEPSYEILTDWSVLSEHVVYKIAKQFRLDGALFKQIVATRGINPAMRLLQYYLGQEAAFQFICGCGWVGQSNDEIIRCPSCGGSIYGTKIT